MPGSSLTAPAAEAYVLLPVQCSRLDRIPRRRKVTDPGIHKKRVCLLGTLADQSLIQMLYLTKLHLGRQPLPICCRPVGCIPNLSQSRKGFQQGILRPAFMQAKDRIPFEGKILGTDQTCTTKAGHSDPKTLAGHGQPATLLTRRRDNTLLYAPHSQGTTEIRTQAGTLARMITDTGKNPWQRQITLQKAARFTKISGSDVPQTTTHIHIERAQRLTARRAFLAALGLKSVHALLIQGNHGKTSCWGAADRLHGGHTGASE